MEDHNKSLRGIVDEVRGMADNFERYGTPWETQVRNQLINRVAWAAVIGLAAGTWFQNHYHVPLFVVLREMLMGGR